MFPLISLKASVTHPASCFLFAGRAFSHQQDLGTSANSVVPAPTAQGTLWKKGEETVEPEEQRGCCETGSPRDVRNYAQKVSPKHEPNKEGNSKHGRRGMLIIHRGHSH